MYRRIQRRKRLNIYALNMHMKPYSMIIWRTYLQSVTNNEHLRLTAFRNRFSKSFVNKILTRVFLLELEEDKALELLTISTVYFIRDEFAMRYFDNPKGRNFCCDFVFIMNVFFLTLSDLVIYKSLF